MAKKKASRKKVTLAPSGRAARPTGGMSQKELAAQYFTQQFQGEGTKGGGTRRAHQGVRGAKGPQKIVSPGTKVDMRKNQKYRKKKK